MRIGQIENGIVLDHITAGNSMNIYNTLKLGELDCTVALIKNAPSTKMGKKDIIKISTDLELDLEILGGLSIIVDNPDLIQLACTIIHCQSLVLGYPFDHSDCLGFYLAGIRICNFYSVGAGIEIDIQGNLPVSIAIYVLINSS